MDAALHRCGVTFVLDRAGVTGEDGASHHGMWDLSVLQVVPGLRLAAPRDGERLRELLREAVDITDAPTVIRIPKGAVQPELPAASTAGDVDVLIQSGAHDVLIVAVGAMAATCLDLAVRLQAQGIGVTVVDPRWVKPVSPHLVELASHHRLVVSVEDSGRVGGCGATLARTLEDAGVDVPVSVFGLPQSFLPHGKRAAILELAGLTAQNLAREVTARVAALEGAGADVSASRATDTA
jgi:1-deoxy-D-xylulose-5-phosphate synthase